MSALESTSPPRLQSLGTRQGSVLLAAAAVAWFVAVLLAFGAVNLTMMLVLTGVILVEKLGDPALAPGLHVTTGGMHLKMGGS